MSRHRIQALNGNHIVNVGWNPSLRSFYGHVHDPERSLSDPLLWVNGAVKPISEVDNLAQAIAGFAEIDVATRRLLFDDRELNR